MVSPGEFIPVAEDTGLVVEIGTWVLRAACEQARRWQDQGFSPIRIAVNISGHQIRQEDFVELVATVLRETGLSASDLELEITESTIMQEDEATDRTFARLNELGVSIALDDFGTGYSSLSYQRRFPIHRLKIDRSFVSGIDGSSDDLAIVRGIIALGHAMGLGIVAEGVETEAQLAALRHLECDVVQGFLYSPPVDAEAVPELLAEQAFATEAA